MNDNTPRTIQTSHGTPAPQKKLSNIEESKLKSSRTTPKRNPMDSIRTPQVKGKEQPHKT